MSKYLRYALLSSTVLGMGVAYSVTASAQTVTLSSAPNGNISNPSGNNYSIISNKLNFFTDTFPAIVVDTDANLTVPVGMFVDGGGGAAIQYDYIDAGSDAVFNLNSGGQVNAGSNGSGTDLAAIRSATGLDINSLTLNLDGAIQTLGLTRAVGLSEGTIDRVDLFITGNANISRSGGSSVDFDLRNANANGVHVTVSGAPTFASPASFTALNGNDTFTFNDTGATAYGSILGNGGADQIFINTDTISFSGAVNLGTTTGDNIIYDAAGTMTFDNGNFISANEFRIYQGTVDFDDARIRFSNNVVLGENGTSNNATVRLDADSEITGLNIYKQELSNGTATLNLDTSAGDLSGLGQIGSTAVSSFMDVVNITGGGTFSTSNYFRAVTTNLADNTTFEMNGDWFYGDMIGSSGVNTVTFNDGSVIAPSATLSLLGGDDVVTLNGDVSLLGDSLDFGAGDDILNVIGDAQTPGFRTNVDMDGGANATPTGDRILVNRDAGSVVWGVDSAISNFEEINITGGTVIFYNDATLTNVPSIVVNNSSSQLAFRNDAGVSSGTVDLQSGSLVSFDRAGATFSVDVTDSNDGGDNQSFILSNGIYDGTISLGSGSDTIQISGGTFSGTHNAGDGSDSVIFNGGAMANATFNNAGAIDAGISVASGNVTIDSGTSIDAYSLSVSNAASVMIADGVDLGATSLLGDITVQNGGTFGGTGRLRTGGTFINQGTYAPGQSIGTQIITGDYSQSAGGTLEIEFDDTSVDLVDISGSAVLAGTVELIELAPGIQQTTTHVFLEADGGVSGTFSNTVESFLSGTQILDATVGYTATTAFAEFSAFSDVDNNDDTDTGPDTTKQGGKVAQAVNRVALSNPTTTTTNIVNALRGGGDVDAALDSQSNLVGSASVAQANDSIGQVVNVVRTRVRPSNVQSTGVSSGESGKLERAFEDRSYWVQAVAGYGDIDTDSNARGTESKSYGTAFGVEYNLAEYDATLGAFGGYTFTNTEVDGLRDEGDVHNYQIGLYGAHDLDGSLRVNGTVSFSYLDFETSRVTSSGTAKADFDGFGTYVTAEALYDIEQDNGLTVSPFAGVEASVIHHESYSETGAGVLNNSVDGETSEYLSSVVGVEVGGKLEKHGLDIAPLARIGWAHQFLDDSASTTASFTQAPEITFESDGPARNRNSLRLGLDLEISDKENSNIVGFVRYDGDIASNAQDHIVRLGASLKF